MTEIFNFCAGQVHDPRVPCLLADLAQIYEISLDAVGTKRGANRSKGPPSARTLHSKAVGTVSMTRQMVARHLPLLLV